MIFIHAMQVKIGYYVLVKKTNWTKVTLTKPQGTEVRGIRLNENCLPVTGN